MLWIHLPKKYLFFQNLSGYHLCRRWQICALNKSKQRKTESFVSISTSREHRIEPFITCSSTGIVYLLQCPCGLQYIGRTKRSMQVRLGEHITNIKNGFRFHSVSKHYAIHHNRNPANTIFLGIDRFSAHWRGSSLVRELSTFEMAWIHRVRCYTPHGLNVDIEVYLFIIDRLPSYWSYSEFLADPVTICLVYLGDGNIPHVYSLLLTYKYSKYEDTLILGDKGYVLENYSW